MWTNDLFQSISIYFIHPGSVSTVEMLSADECGTQRCRKPLEKRGMKFVVSSCGKGQNFYLFFFFFKNDNWMVMFQSPTKWSSVQNPLPFHYDAWRSSMSIGNVTMD